jgi:hypothetical protein
MRIGKIIEDWAVVAGLLFWNGVLELGVYKPLFGFEAGEMMGAFMAMAAVFWASRPFLLEEQELPPLGLFRVGALWFVLTLILEVGLGRLTALVVPRAAPAYGMWSGSFWLLILLSSFAAPIIWLRRSGFPAQVTK